MSLSFVLIILAVVAVTGGLAWLSAWMERKKREAFRALATKLNFIYQPEMNHGLATQYAFLTKLNTGSNRYASHILSGTSGGYELLAFDHHHETYTTDSKGNRTTHHYHHSVFIVNLPREFPKLTIYPEGIFSKIAQAFGYDDIDFESAEFSRAFCVRSPDKRFAYDICHALAIEFLLENRSLGLEIGGHTLAAIDEGALSSTEVESRLARLIAFRKLMPEYLIKTTA
ncbi:hypothetical protein BH09VER1_BH09VER1_15990 [soil metagenome]